MTPSRVAPLFTRAVAGKLAPLNVPPRSLSVTVGVALAIVKVTGPLLAGE